MAEAEEPSVLTWIYFLTISLVSVAASICCIVYGIDNIIFDAVDSRQDVTGLCWMFSLFTGCTILILSIIWSASAFMFKSCLSSFRTALAVQNVCHEVNNNGDEKNEKNYRKRRLELKGMRRKLSVLRLTILFSMLTALLTELCSTGIFWYTGAKIENYYLVTKNCFCAFSTESEGGNRNWALAWNCPKVDDSQRELYCLSVYEPQRIIIDQYNTTSFTLPCQTLSGGGLQELACLQFSTFWFWFKILRVLLPFLVLVKLPIIFVNCFISLVKDQTEINDRLQNSSWFNLENMMSGGKCDPIQFYRDMCAPVQRSPVGIRLGPYGQEQDKNDTSLPPDTTQSHHYFMPGKMVKCPTVPSLSSVQDNSPPARTENTFSTPMPSNRKILNPTFNMSHVVRLTPGGGLPSSLTNLHASIPSNHSARSRLSSFGPAREDLAAQLPRVDDMPLPPPPETHTLGGVDNDMDDLLPPPPPALDGSLYAVHDIVSGIGAPVINIIDCPSDSSVSSSMVSTPGSGSYRGLKGESSASSKKLSSRSPVPTILRELSGSRVGAPRAICYSDIKEIASRARQLSNSSNVDWTTLP